MKHSLWLLLASLPLALALVLLPGCGCGFDCNDDDDDKEPAIITIGLSDSLPEDLEEVVIEIDSIVLKRDDASEADVVFDTFTVSDLDAVDADTIRVDLLQYKGARELVIIANQEIEADFYNAIEINVIDGDVNNSYVMEANTDTAKILNVDNGTLTISGRDIRSGENFLTIEFGLPRALQYKAGDDSYLLDNQGIQLIDRALFAQVSGVVDSDLFDTEDQCADKDDPEVGNRLYLYQGTGLDADNLADVFNSGNANATSKEAPYAVATMSFNDFTGNWEYSFGYLPEGDYTLAFSCNTEDDDSVDFDALTIPLPTDQIYDFTVSQSEQFVCALTAEPSC